MDSVDRLRTSDPEFVASIDQQSQRNGRVIDLDHPEPRAAQADQRDRMRVDRIGLAALPGGEHPSPCRQLRRHVDHCLAISDQPLGDVAADAVAFGAARLLGDVGDITRFADKGRFASWNGTAPLDASSGEQNRHRLSRAGNRRINRVLHIMAIVALRNDTEGRRYYRRKVAAGKSNMMALRALKRRLSDIVYNQMRADAQRLAAGPGGQPGATLQSSAADSHPDIDTSEQSLPGPAKTNPRTDLATVS